MGVEGTIARAVEAEEIYANVLLKVQDNIAGLEQGHRYVLTDKIPVEVMDVDVCAPARYPLDSISYMEKMERNIKALTHVMMPHGTLSFLPVEPGMTIEGHLNLVSLAGCNHWANDRERGREVCTTLYAIKPEYKSRK